MESISKAKISLLNSLKRKKIRYEKRLFTVEGKKCVMETLRHFSCEFLAATNDFDSKGCFEQIPCYEISARDMGKVTGFSTPSRIIGVFRMPSESSSASTPSGNYELLLDGIQDPGNLGTIIRTADWFGFRRIFASSDTVDCFNAKTVQAAMGSLGRVGVIYCNLEEVVNRFPEKPLVGLLLDGDDIYSSALPESALICMGNEGNGISEAMRKRVSFPLRIPPYPEGAETAESLNVSVATGITLSEFRRKIFR